MRFVHLGFSFYPSMYFACQMSCCVFAFIQALVKELGGGDYLAIAWEYPGQKLEVIPSRYSCMTNPSLDLSISVPTNLPISSSTNPPLKAETSYPTHLSVAATPSSTYLAVVVAVTPYPADTSVLNTTSPPVFLPTNPP